MLTATLDLCMLDNTHSDTTRSIRPIIIGLIFPRFDTLKNDPIFLLNYFKVASKLIFAPRNSIRTNIEMYTFAWRTFP